MQEIKVRLTFTEEILGTAAADKEIHKTYIASLAPNAPSKKEGSKQSAWKRRLRKQ